MDGYKWHDSRETVLNVAFWAVNECLLTNVDEVLAFFEKPWNYDELWESWGADPATLTTI